MPMRAARLVGALLDDDVAHLLDGVRLGRRRVVVEEAGAAGEALDAEQLLGVQAPVVLAELGVALVRDLAAADVEHRVHYRAHDRWRSLDGDRSGTEKGARVAPPARRARRLAGDGAPTARRCRRRSGSGGTARRCWSTRSPTSRSSGTSRQSTGAVALRTDEHGDELAVSPARAVDRSARRDELPPTGEVRGRSPPRREPSVRDEYSVRSAFDSRLRACASARPAEQRSTASITSASRKGLRSSRRHRGLGGRLRSRAAEMRISGPPARSRADAAACGRRRRPWWASSGRAE